MDIRMTTDISELINVVSHERLASVEMESAYDRIISVASYFGIIQLPEDIRIHIHICDKAEFEDIRQGIGINIIDEAVAFVSDINHIYVIKYDCIKRFLSKSSYSAIILHECIHVFQLYYSKLPQSQYIWLYESVACYLADQKKQYDRRSEKLWDAFVNDFYNVPDCYGLAYDFGRKLFETYYDEVLSIIKYPEKYWERLVDLFYAE